MPARAAYPRYRQMVLAVAGAVLVHGVILWFAWPVVGQWVQSVSEPVSRAAQVLSRQQLDDAFNQTPIFTGPLIPAGALDALSAEDYSTPAWQSPGTPGVLARLPYTPMAWKIQSHRNVILEARRPFAEGSDRDPLPPDPLPEPPVD